MQPTNVSKDKIGKSDDQDDIVEDYENDFNDFDNSDKISERKLHKEIPKPLKNAAVKNHILEPKKQENVEKADTKPFNNKSSEHKILNKHNQASVYFKPVADPYVDKKPLDFFDSRAKPIITNHKKFNLSDDSSDYGDDFDIENVNSNNKNQVKAIKPIIQNEKPITVPTGPTPDPVPTNIVFGDEPSFLKKVEKQIEDIKVTESQSKPK